MKITIDGQQYEVAAGQRIIEAAFKRGIDIPHFCWHPRLMVSGNCRMCLVEVERMPKLVIACATTVADGMVIHTKSPQVINAQEAVLEFILINHPLDCPICDEAGECKLQDYTYKYSAGISRFQFDKVRKSKRVALGPNVMLDVERCIMCSRCVRFCEEIAKKPQLTFVQRADHVELTTFPGESLDSPYSMNTIEICPVGALTSRDFRFKARVWEMSKTNSVCPGCARGCNMYMWVKENKILRLTPRLNEQVNDYWMCDYGRLNTFQFVNAETRINGPMVRRDGELVEVSWEEAIAAAALGLKRFNKTEIAGVGSAFAMNEDNYMFVKFMKHVLGTKNIDFMRHVKEGDEDDILIRADRTPNSYGAEAVGVRPDEGGLALEGISTAIGEGKIKALYVIDDDIVTDSAVARVLEQLDFLVVHASNENATTRIADVVLSSATYAEKHGTFTNFQGRVQRIRPAVATIEQDRALEGFAMSRLDRFASHNDRWGRWVKRDARPTWRIIAGVANALGSKFRYLTVEDVFNEIGQKVDSFRGLTYLKVGSQGSMLRSKTATDAAKVQSEA
ncbi:MAG: molybdopterin-dependent oxidoreductase [Bacteroidota bacterium]